MIVQNDVENHCKKIYYSVLSNSTIKFVLLSLSRDVHEKDPELKEKELSHNIYPMGEIVVYRLGEQELYSSQFICHV
jgi:hypothetical protein